MKNIPFHGIVAVGTSLSAAIAQYRGLACGKNVTVFTDAGQSLSFVANSSSRNTNFNPMDGLNTGNSRLVANPGLASSLQFASQSGDGENDGRKVYHFHCENSCDCHTVFDSPELVKFCPVCTAAVGEDVVEEEDEDEGEEVVEDEDESDDFDSESEDDTESDSEDEDSEEDGDEEDDSDEDSEEDGDEEDDSDEDSEDEDEPVVVAAASKQEAIELYVNARKNHASLSSGGSVDVELMRCSSATCGAYILSEATLTKCPIHSCSADLEEPEEDEDDDLETLLPEENEDEDEGDDVSESEDEEAGEDEEPSEDDSDSEEEDDTEPESEDEEAGEDEEPSEDANVTEDEIQSESSATDTLEINLMRSICGSDSQKLDIAFATICGAPQWSVWYDGKPVAVCTEADAGENKDLFATKDFGRAVLAAVQRDGTEILSQLGFKPLTQTISVAAEVTQRVNEAIASARAELDVERKEYNERLLAALATASIGMARGFFKDVKHPLKSALVESLSTAGVANPEVLMDRCFSVSADEYHRTLFEKAGEIMTKPAEVQEGLAKAVLDMEYQATASSSTASAVKLSTRLSSMGNAVATSTSSTTGNQQGDSAAGQATSESSADSFEQLLQKTTANLGNR